MRLFVIFCQNVELNSVFQPEKTVCEKKFRPAILDVLYLAQKCLDLAEIFRK